MKALDLTLQFFKHRIFLMTSFSPRAEQRLLRKGLAEYQYF